MHPTFPMPAITHLMKRLGFVKLDRYGLVLTPEGRIMSLRPTVLDDGLGGKVVGWQEGDLAAMELDPWEPFRPASQRAVASRVAITMLPARVPAPFPAPLPAPVPVAVAPEPVVEEDEWEWEIAIARARVAADEVQTTVAALTPRRTKPTPPPLPPAPRTLPMPVVTITAEPMTSGTWPKTEPLGTIDYEDYTSPLAEVVRVPPRIVEPTTPSARAAPVAKSVRPGTSPVTVIPVPRLPSLRDGGTVTPIEQRAMPPRRYPKGTGPVDPNHLADQTKPGIVLSPAGALPSFKQRTASRG
jgi:hypothetical protein